MLIFEDISSFFDSNIQLRSCLRKGICDLILLRTCSNSLYILFTSLFECKYISYKRSLNSFAPKESILESIYLFKIILHNCFKGIPTFIACSESDFSSDSSCIIQYLLSLLSIAARYCSISDNIFLLWTVIYSELVSFVFKRGCRNNLVRQPLNLIR